MFDFDFNHIFQMLKIRFNKKENTYNDNLISAVYSEMCDNETPLGKILNTLCRKYSKQFHDGYIDYVIFKEFLKNSKLSNILDIHYFDMNKALKNVDIDVINTIIKDRMTIPNTLKKEIKTRSKIMMAENLIDFLNQGLEGYEHIDISKIQLNDVRYLIPSEDDLITLIEHFRGNELPYIEEQRDCDDFAMIFKAYLSREGLGNIMIGLVYSLIKQENSDLLINHAMDLCFYYGKADNELKTALIEPQASAEENKKLIRSNKPYNFVKVKPYFILI